MPQRSEGRLLLGGRQGSAGHRCGLRCSAGRLQRKPARPYERRPVAGSRRAAASATSGRTSAGANGRGSSSLGTSTLLAAGRPERMPPLEIGTHETPVARAFRSRRHSPATLRADSGSTPRAVAARPAGRPRNADRLPPGSRTGSRDRAPPAHCEAPRSVGASGLSDKASCATANASDVREILEVIDGRQRHRRDEREHLLPALGVHARQCRQPVGARRVKWPTRNWSQE